MMTRSRRATIDWILSTPLMPAIASSIGSITSRSTLSGDAPGYGTETPTTGVLHVRELVGLEQRSAKMPNTTSASIATMVTIGRLIAKSEMNMAQLCGRRCRRQLQRRARGDRLRRSDQQAIAVLHAAGDLDPLGLIVAQAERYGDRSALPSVDAQHPGRRLGRVHRAQRQHQRAPRLVRDPPFREQTGDQPPGGIGDRHENRDLPRDRIGGRADPLDRDRRTSGPGSRAPETAPAGRP